MALVLLATGGYDGSIRFWDASTGACYKSFEHRDRAGPAGAGGEKQVNCLEISPDKQFIVAGGNPAIKLYDVNARGAEPLVVYEGHTSNVTAVGFQRDGRWMFSASEDGTVKIWDPRAATFQRDYACRHGVNACALHPNQGELISGDHGGAVRVWDLAASACSAEIAPEGDTPVSSLSIAPDASLLAVANFNGSVFAYASAAAAAAAGGSGKAAAAEGSAADGPAEASTPAGGGAAAAEASPEGWVPVKRLAAHNAYVTAARLSPDARLLATASSDRTVRVWRTGDWGLSSTLSGHGRWVWDASFSADSSYIATASSDMTAMLWEAAAGEAVRVYRGHCKAVTAVALNDAHPIVGS